MHTENTSFACSKIVVKNCYKTLKKGAFLLFLITF